jgi:hypothetical protein
VRRDGPHRIVRGELAGLAAEVYVPRRGRAARHYADAFSVALWIAKQDPATGERWAFDLAAALVPLVPEGTGLILTPPASRRRSAQGWYFARELGAGVARLLGVPLGRPLTWQSEGQEASKSIRHQAGKGRALGRCVLCDEDLSGARVCLVDDLFTTGITLQLCAQAATAAGAASPVGIVTLGVTERTTWRPAEEQARVRMKAQVKQLREQRA